MKKIIVLWPTIRPDMFIQTVNDWIERSVYEDSIFYLPRVKDVNQAVTIGRACNGYRVYPSIGNKSVPSAMYAQCLTLNCDDDDIILNTQDDQYPPNKWDEIVREQFADHDGAVFFRDGIQEYPSPTCVMPCLTFKALKKLNRIIYHPDYEHLWPDTEYYYNCVELGIMKDVRQTRPDILFEHRHPCNGKRPADDVDALISSSEAADRATYERRMKLSLTERLKV